VKRHIWPQATDISRFCTAGPVWQSRETAIFVVFRDGDADIVRHAPDGVSRPVRSRALAEIASGAPEPISAGVMFAVIRTGGKQYKVAKDDVVAVEKLAGEPGAAIELAEVLMIGEGAEVATGTPLLAGASVAATVVEQKRAPKIIVFKKQRRKNYRRKKGHRQYQTVLRITEIRGAVGSLPLEDERPVVEAEPAAEAEPVTEAEPAVEAGPTGGEGASNGA